MGKAMFLALAAAIILAGCAQQQPQAQACNFAGKWSTNWGEMDLAQSGPNVTGTYVFDQGRINGTVSGSSMSGTWSENANENAYLPPDNAGDVVLNLSSDCSNITGEWRYGSEGGWQGDWSGTRMK